MDGDTDDDESVEGFWACFGALVAYRVAMRRELLLPLLLVFWDW